MKNVDKTNGINAIIDNILNMKPISNFVSDVISNILSLLVLFLIFKYRYYIMIIDVVFIFYF